MTPDPPPPPDLLPGDDPPAPAPRHRATVCEFCDCRLTASGEVLHFSEKAKRWRDGDLESAATAKKVAQLERDLETARSDLAALQKKTASSSMADLLR